MRSFSAKLLIFIFVCELGVATANSLLESTLLINLSQLSRSENSQNTNRRSYQKFVGNENDDENKAAFEKDDSLVKISNSIASTFESSRDEPISTSPSLEKSLTGFSDEVTLKQAIDYVADNKLEMGLSDGVLLSAIKSIYKVYVASTPETVKEAPEILLNSILPKVSEWGGSSETWIKRLAQITTEVLVNSGQPNLVADNAAYFTKQVVEISTKDFEGVDKTRVSKNDKMKFGNDKDGGWSGFDPSKFTAYQQLAVGLTQGFLNSKLSLNDSRDFPQLVAQDFEELSNTAERSKEFSLIKSATDSLLNTLKVKQDSNSGSDNDSSLYIYDSIKALANGFVLSSTVYATSEPDYLANGLYKDAAELVSRGVANSAVSHDIAESEGISVGRIAESVAHGSAMGAQLATVLPKSMEYIKNWEIFSQSRRDIAQSVSQGSSFGAVDAASSRFSDMPVEVEKVSRGSSLGSMMGTTGLAIYYPTDQLVPIINSVAQGSAFGSLSSKKISNIELDSPATEPIESMIARQSAFGSSLGAIFEPTVLLNLPLNTNSDERQTIDNLSAASFGATIGSIQGVKKKNAQSTPNEIVLPIVEIAQSTKQGSTEGALAGAKLALNINEELSVENLNSKGSLLKAINSSNAQAANEAVTPRIGNSSNAASAPLASDPTNISSQNMLYLMRKYGVNPKYSSTGAVYKKPSVPLINEPREDLFSEQPSDQNQSDSYSDKIVNASPI